LKKYRAGQELILPKKYHKIAYDLQRERLAINKTIVDLSMHNEKLNSEFWEMTRNIFPNLIENYKVRFIAGDNKFVVSYEEDKED